MALRHVWRGVWEFFPQTELCGLRGEAGMTTTPRAKPRTIRIGQTWSSRTRDRLIVDLTPARLGHEATIRYREDGIHRTIMLRSFRTWITTERAAIMEANT
jgi:hypothetical protein